MWKTHINTNLCGIQFIFENNFRFTKDAAIAISENSQSCSGMGCPPCLLLPTSYLLVPTLCHLSPLPPPVPQWLEPSNPPGRAASSPPEIGKRCRKGREAVWAASWGRLASSVVDVPSSPLKPGAPASPLLAADDGVGPPATSVEAHQVLHHGGDSQVAFTFNNMVRFSHFK